MKVNNGVTINKIKNKAKFFLKSHIESTSVNLINYLLNFPLLQILMLTKFFKIKNTHAYAKATNRHQQKTTLAVLKKVINKKSR